MGHIKGNSFYYSSVQKVLFNDYDNMRKIIFSYIILINNKTNYYLKKNSI